ncbi:UDP-N-acetylmuramoyl-tripeptide--D-alanyl-D-alanine ligase [Ranunculus cassubicifolius]
MRSELIIAKNGIQIINDVYNANPTSTLSAINSLKAMECRGKRVAILGDMLELGSAEASFHETVLGLCCVQDIGLVGLVICALDANSLAIKIAEWLETDDVVLVKGSRGMKMERVVDAIKACRG